MTHNVLYQSWEESERGWGVRPDGISLHLSEQDRNAYIEAYWERMHAISPTAPSEYERPAGEPGFASIGDELYERLQETDNGLRLYAHQVREESIDYIVRGTGWNPVGGRK